MGLKSEIGADESGTKNDVPIDASVMAQRASQELLGVLSLRDLTPIWTTRTMAATMQMRPTAKIPPMLNFCARGI